MNQILFWFKLVNPENKNPLHYTLAEGFVSI